MVRFALSPPPLPLGSRQTIFDHCSGYSPHTFRHAFAKGWLGNGGDIFKLSRVLGHSEMQTTQVYLRGFQSREARADHAQFSPVERLRLGKGGSGKRGNDRHR